MSGASPTYAWGAGLWNTGEPNNSGGSENCAQYSATGKLNDLPCTLSATGAGDLLWGCCEAPASPVNTCPAGFTGLDNAGYCYKGLTVAGGYSWDTASSACRALNGGNAWSASPIDTDNRGLDHHQHVCGDADWNLLLVGRAGQHRADRRPHRPARDILALHECGLYLAVPPQ